MKKSISLFILLAIFNNGLVQATAVKNSEFLKFTKSQQHWWYAGAVESIGHLVFLHDEEKAQCIWNWLPSDPKRKKDLLIKSFRKYPDYTPTSILIALLKRDCGSLLPAG
ncbi:MAG: hypothetical protein L3J26_06800 [Candidatus Polarisedimenticolaceae bacterium]|nr:hypothetical protein [Candidatus Polarisedimenticolaceae bacterium]